MDVFLSLVVKLIPLYMIIFLWIIASKKLQAQKETVAKLLIYIISPVVIFYWTYTATLDASVFLLPAFFFTLCCCICLLFLYIWKLFFWTNKIKNILAFTAGTWNTGYFWLPIILVFFDEKMFSIAVLSILGFSLYENTLGFYITAKWNYSSKESILKVITLPTIYAFFLWITINALWIEIWEIMHQSINNFKWAYTVLWMLIIGMWLSWIKKSSFRINFLTLTFAAKFLVWPLLVLAYIYVDKKALHLFSDEIYSIMILISIVPLAANTIALAADFDVYPEEATIAVFLSTVFALFYIPLMVTFLI